jgi:hypothetical protein
MDTSSFPALFIRRGENFAYRQRSVRVAIDKEGMSTYFLLLNITFCNLSILSTARCQVCIEGKTGFLLLTIALIQTSFWIAVTG